MDNPRFLGKYLQNGGFSSQLSLITGGYKLSVLLARSNFESPTKPLKVQGRAPDPVGKWKPPGPP